MADYLTPEALSIAWKNADRGLQEIARQAFIEFGKDAKRAALLYSQGPLSQKQLDKMGNPYATRHSEQWKRGGKKGRSKDPNAAAEVAQGMVGQSAGIINKGKTGLFSKSWHWETSGNLARGITGSLSNDAQRNGFRYGNALFSGTSKMIARPTLADIAFQSMVPKVDGQFGRVVNLIGDFFIGNVIGESGFRR